MKLERVLLVTKRSTYELFAEDSEAGRVALSKVRGEKVKALLKSHEDHYRTLEVVEKALERMKLSVDRLQRGKSFDDNGYDLAIAVGGDGTFIAASHHLREVPLLGVNSAPRESVGFFCAATARDLKLCLERIRRDELSRTLLSRLSVEVAGKPVAIPALNDVLYSHLQPAGMARYLLTVPGGREEQKSSGIWIAAPAGSGGGAGSAGGRQLPITARKYQFVVREPYREPGRRYGLLKGVLGPEDVLEIECHIGQGRIFIDGPHVARRVPFGAKVRIRLSACPLEVLGLKKAVKARAARRRGRR